MKRHIEIVKVDEVAIDAIPLATKPPMIVEYQNDKDGRMGYFKLIRADGSSKRYSSIIKMLQGIDREDLETLWKLVKAKHGNTRPEEDYERVLRGDLKVIVHFVRFRNLHIFMLVEKRYPLTPITISNMLNKMLQAPGDGERLLMKLKDSEDKHQEEQVPASTKTFSSSQSQLPQVKDKGKGKMVDPEVPLKKKDQGALDEELARNLKAQLQAKLIKEERLVRQKEEKANIALIKSWDNTQAMMEADFELA
ncbi:hypothetical protein Tco_0970710 [Tanacetum coccineum]